MIASTTGLLGFLQNKIHRYHLTYNMSYDYSLIKLHSIHHFEILIKYIWNCHPHNFGHFLYGPMS